MVSIKIPSMWRAACQGMPVVQVPPGSLLEALKEALDQYPRLKAYLFLPSGEVNPVLNFYINQEHIRFRGDFQAAVEDGDEIYIIPMITGGRS